MLNSWLRYLWENEDGFFGVGMGPSKTEQTEQGALGSLAGFATGEGEQDILTSDNFWKAILSGDPTQIAKVLGPQMSAINKQSQQTKKTANEFGNRGGGTNAFMQETGDKATTEINRLISELTGKAAGALGSQGSGLLSTGVGAHEGAFGEAKTIHDQNQAKWGDIFNSIAQIVGGVAGGVAGVPGGSSAGSVMFGQAGGGAGFDNPMSIPTIQSDLPNSL